MKKIDGLTLINNHIDYLTRKPYKDVGSIFRDALSHVPNTVNFISIMDDDDIYLPNHFSRGIECLIKHKNYHVWKPGYYFLKTNPYDVEYRESDNNLEASCILHCSFLKEHGFNIGVLSGFHLSWLFAAEERKTIFLDNEQIIPTYCYEFDQVSVVHISSIVASNPELNREDINRIVKSIGDYGTGKILTPWDEKRLKLLFDVYFNIDNYEEAQNKI